MAARIVSSNPRLQLLGPCMNAYILALLLCTGPRIATVLVSLGKGKLGPREIARQLLALIRHEAAPHRFPASCATLVGGSTLLQIPIRALLAAVLPTSARPALNTRQHRRVVAFVAALISASLSFRLLNSVPSSARLQQANPPNEHEDGTSHLIDPFKDPPEPRPDYLDHAEPNASSLSRVDLAGRTMDLTLFAAVRALDIVVTAGWKRLSPSRSRKLRVVRKVAPTALFCFSAATIMHAWFYTPLRLPRAYNRWISAAAELDQRLLTVLRHARYGNFIYGKDTGMAPLLGSMCRDYGFPEVWGDPCKTVPVPCELVHMGQGPNCEKHALWRFWRGWFFAARMYAPLKLFVLVRQAIQHRRSWGKYRLEALPPTLLRALIEVARNSAFLGAFISFFYYGVCLSRTRLGPKVFSSKTVTPQMWDSGLCVLAGSLLCGPSILVEQAKKRMEILLFVLPRAAAVWFPRRYLIQHRWKEQLAFSLSAALILTAAQEDPRLVRGMLGRLLGKLLKVD
ncbi:hypothetical protein M011DRAFT_475742 [Sporormia fimetaria CBS 119925]|uniref:Integral membrane protein n=1 Tax=Sporormia fimetaria CBS 119925 TaxID=1340428 RepID=A0A6A6VHD1_9PLEO|nr:hypothetical protein M011DRAFT_475742 [Sporormia fimetaria CBS 119925]